MHQAGLHIQASENLLSQNPCQKVCCLQAAGLIGCFRFLEGFYLLLVTQRRYHGTVCGTLSLQQAAHEVFQ